MYGLTNDDPTIYEHTSSMVALKYFLLSKECYGAKVIGDSPLSDKCENFEQQIALDECGAKFLTVDNLRTHRCGLRSRAPARWRRRSSPMLIYLKSVRWQ